MPDGLTDRLTSFGLFAERLQCSLLPGGSGSRVPASIELGTSAINSKKFWLAFLVVYVVYQFAGFLIHAVWLDPVYESLVGVFRSEEEMNPMSWVFFVTSLVMVFFFCFMFTRGYENKGIGEGARYGLYMGLFFMTVQAFDAYVIYPLPYSLVFKWFASGLGLFIVMGIVMALVYKPAD